MTNKIQIEEELKNLEELEGKASIGPWEHYSAMCCPDMGGVSSANGRVCDDKVGHYGHPMTIEDAKFVEAARNLLPRLLKEYRKLQDKVERLEDVLKHCEAMRWVMR